MLGIQRLMRSRTPQNHKFLTTNDLRNFKKALTFSTLFAEFGDYLAQI